MTPAEQSTNSATNFHQAISNLAQACNPYEGDRPQASLWEIGFLAGASDAILDRTEAIHATILAGYCAGQQWRYMLPAQLWLTRSGKLALILEVDFTGDSILAIDHEGIPAVAYQLSRFDLIRKLDEHPPDGDRPCDAKVDRDLGGDRTKLLRLHHQK